MCNSTSAQNGRGSKLATDPKRDAGGGTSDTPLLRSKGVGAPPPVFLELTKNEVDAPSMSHWPSKTCAIFDIMIGSVANACRIWVTPTRMSKYLYIELLAPVWPHSLSMKTPESNPWLYFNITSHRNGSRQHKFHSRVRPQERTLVRKEGGAPHQRELGLK